MFNIKIKKSSLIVTNKEPIASGASKVYYVSFDFDEEWEGLIKNVIFKAGETSISVLLEGDNCPIPWEVLSSENIGEKLWVGVYGSDTEGTKLPTVWNELEIIQAGAELCGSGSEPTPTAVSLIYEASQNAENLAKEAVKEASLSRTYADQALKAKEDAINEAKNAKDSATLAVSNAQNAEMFCESAEQAKNSAIDAQRGAEQAQEKAEEAQRNAEQSQGKAEEAQGKAEEARRKSEKYAGMLESSVEPAVIKGEGEDSVVFNFNSRSLSPYTKSGGTETIAGGSAFNVLYASETQDGQGFLALFSDGIAGDLSEFDRTKWEELCTVVNESRNKGEELYYSVSLEENVFHAGRIIDCNTISPVAGPRYYGVYVDNYDNLKKYIGVISALNAYLLVEKHPELGTVDIGSNASSDGYLSIAHGPNSTARGMNTLALGKNSSAEGEETIAGDNAHSEGTGSFALGMASHAEGYHTASNGNSSHAEGQETQTIGKHSHAEGYQSIAEGASTHAEGHHTVASGYASHAEGEETQANAAYSHAEGYWTKANGHASHAEGQGVPYGKAGYDTYTGASGNCSHIEGNATTASGDHSHAEGEWTISSGKNSHAEGYNTKASGANSHAEGDYTEASGKNSHAEGYNTKASGEDSHAEGYITIASGYASHAEGYGTRAIGANSHAEGVNNTAEGYAAHAGGDRSSANWYVSFAHGEGVVAGTYQQAVFGKYNSENKDAMFIVGCGSNADTRANAFRVNLNGKCFAKGTFTASTTAADFAEFFEWSDGNPNNEDRRGLFVTLDGDKIRLANAGDVCIGVVSSNDAFTGNAASDYWQGRYITDVFGAIVYEEVTIPAIIDKKSGEIVSPTHIELQPITNPEYDHSKEYIPRENRKEWSVVGLVGQIVIIDDGTCVVGGYAEPSVNGIGTNSTKGYRVMKRIDENHIKVLVK